MAPYKWFEISAAPDKRLGFLAIGNDDQDEMVRIFRKYAAFPLNDGVIFDPNSVQVDRIREESDYGGLRITANAR